MTQIYLVNHALLERLNIHIGQNFSMTVAGKQHDFILKRENIIIISNLEKIIEFVKNNMAQLLQNDNFGVYNDDEETNGTPEMTSNAFLEAKLDLTG
jgi:hypothetical protein